MVMRCSTLLLSHPTLPLRSGRVGAPGSATYIPAVSKSHRNKNVVLTRRPRVGEEDMSMIRPRQDWLLDPERRPGAPSCSRRTNRENGEEAGFDRVPSGSPLKS